MDIFAPFKGSSKLLLNEEEAMQISQLQKQNKDLKARNIKLEKRVGNTHICSRYVPTWKLKEGLRELIQNFFDACLRRCIELGHNIDFIFVRHQLVQTADGKKTFRNFWVYTNEQNQGVTVLGIIKYDPDQMRLTFQNAGFIAKGCLLLGGGNKDNDSKCAGKFGEGLKLAILALLRLDRAPNQTSASTNSAPPRPAPLQRQSSGEPVRPKQTDQDIKLKMVEAREFGGSHNKADPQKMTVKIVTPKSADSDEFEQWDFWLGDASEFPSKDGSDERCMFFDSKPIPKSQGVTVQVFGLGIDDWNAQIKNYRRLTDDKKWHIHVGKWPDQTPWLTSNGNKAIQDDHQGYVYLHPDQAGRLYVKGILVSDSRVPLGFDFDNLSVDRDRQHITDFWGQCRRVSHMLVAILNRVDHIKDRYSHLIGADFLQGGGAQLALDRLWEVSFRLLKSDHMRYASEYAQQHVADRFFMMWRKSIGEGEIPTGGKDCPFTMPLNSSDKVHAAKVMQEYGLSLDAQTRVYPCRAVDWRVANMLKKSKHYQKVETVLAKLGVIPTDSDEVKLAKRKVEKALKDLRRLQQTK